MQEDFLLEVLKQCKAKNMHTCIDTAGVAPINRLEEICNNEKGFRENLITISTRENDFGIKFIENPLEEVYLQYY